MFHIPKSESTFYSLLQHIDDVTVKEAQEKSCAFCHGPLDRADFLRKPRGLCDGVKASFNIRYSLCCRREGCRKRITPKSVRFLGRSVYLMFFIVLASSASKNEQRRIAALCGVSIQTIFRWRRYWQEKFTRTPFWRQSKGVIMPPCQNEDLPGALLRRFGWRSDIPLTIIPILRFLAPCAG